ncbi:2628_t:CDS:2, partial [Acaulospora colombiana]
YLTKDEFLSERVKKFMRDCSKNFNKPIPEWARNKQNEEYWISVQREEL